MIGRTAEHNHTSSDQFEWRLNSLAMLQVACNKLTAPELTLSVRSFLEVLPIGIGTNHDRTGIGTI